MFQFIILKQQKLILLNVKNDSNFFTGEIISRDEVIFGGNV